jgi:hypothetical protein
LLYRREDLERASIRGIDRNGQLFQSPLVSLSIGVVSDCFHCSHAIDELSPVTAEAKRRAKQSASNISHISLDWRYPMREPRPIAYVAQPFNLLDRFQRQLFHFSEEDALAELK